ncbi:MAG: hypothetical protein AB9915_02825 [Candidatus Dojkabacteria bacterium]
MQILENTKAEKFQILTNKYLQLSLLYILAFSIPFLLKGPQLLVGSLINFLLILSISQFKFKEIFLVFFLPSIAVYTYGVLFRGATNFLLYLIPCISISNAIYAYSYKNLKFGDFNIIFSSILKTLFLFTCTYILFKSSLLPQIFLTSMGLIQLVTAITGGIVAHSLVRLFKERK